MKFAELKLDGLYLIELEPLTDLRGYFARSFCAKEFEKRALKSWIAQCNISFNAFKGTLRGMHFQRRPSEEAKLVSVASGAIYDVSLDLRAGSQTYLSWTAVELTASNRKAIYIPDGACHDNPAFNIQWPLIDPVLSEKDRSYSQFIP